MSALASLFAHQGGWDEIAFVALPIAIFAGLLMLANRRAQSVLDAEAAAAGDAGDDEAGPS